MREKGTFKGYMKGDGSSKAEVYVQRIILDTEDGEKIKLTTKDAFKSDYREIDNKRQNAVELGLKSMKNKAQNMIGLGTKAMII